jgi:hypothetical protein
MTSEWPFFDQTRGALACSEVSCGKAAQALRLWHGAVRAQHECSELAWKERLGAAKQAHAVRQLVTAAHPPAACPLAGTSLLHQSAHSPGTGVARLVGGDDFELCTARVHHQ